MSSSYYPHGSHHYQWPLPGGAPARDGAAVPRQQSSTSAAPPAHSTQRDNTPILTATGRKRKRLQRACVACHKAKRRCDGGLPCSNCDFSGRQCTYSDAQGKTVPPTQRTSSSNIQAHALTQNAHLWQQTPASTGYVGMGSAPCGVHAQSPTSPQARISPTLSEPQLSPASLALPEPNAETRRELLATFFSQLPAYSTVFDEIAFLRDLSTSEVSNVLLYSIYAVSARYQEQTTAPPSHARSERFTAETYAKAARKMLYEEDPSTGLTLLDDPQLETSQALCMLAAYELGVGRQRRASMFMNLSTRSLVALKLHEGAVPPPRRVTTYSEASAGVKSARRAHCQRFLSLAWTLDVVISALSGENTSFRPCDIDAARGAFLATNTPGLDDVTASFVHTLGVVDVFSQALDYGRRRSNGAGCEMALQRWAESLPPTLTFDEENLASAAMALQGDVGGRHQTHRRQSSMSIGAAQNWTVMHGLAECATFLLSTIGGNGVSSRREAAFKNLIIILETMGSQIRQGPLALVPILICSRIPGDRDPPTQAKRWLDDAKALWTLGDEQCSYEKLVGNTRNFAAPSWISRSPRSSLLAPPSSSDSSSSPPLRRTPPPPRHHRSASGMPFPPLLNSSHSLPALRFSPPSTGTTTSGFSDRKLSPMTFTSAGRSSPESSSLPPPLSLALPAPNKIFENNNGNSANGPSPNFKSDPFRFDGGGRGFGVIGAHR